MINLVALGRVAELAGCCWGGGAGKVAAAGGAIGLVLLYRF